MAKISELFIHALESLRITILFPVNEWYKPFIPKIIIRFPDPGQSVFGPYFPVFGLNTEIDCIQSKYRKIRTYCNIFNCVGIFIAMIFDRWVVFTNI